MRVPACLLAVVATLALIAVPGCSSPESREARLDRIRARIAEDVRFLVREVGTPMAEAAARAAVEEALRKAPDLSGIRDGEENSP